VITGRNWPIFVGPREGLAVFVKFVAVRPGAARDLGPIFCRAAFWGRLRAALVVFRDRIAAGPRHTSSVVTR